MSAQPEPLPEIHLSAMAYTFGHWMPRQDHESLDLSAPYQRGSVWTVEQRRALIRSLIQGVPIGAVIVSVQPETSAAHLRVIDGKQRIETCRAWANNEFGVPGWWFRDEYVTARSLPEARWADLTERGHRRFEMSIMVPALEFDGRTAWLDVDPETNGWRSRRRSAEELLAVEAVLYGLVNSAGTPQTADDLARAAATAGGAR